MKRSCSYCGRIHDRKYDCPSKPKFKRKVTEIDKFRWSKLWKKKRVDIRERDLNLCRICFNNDEFNANELEVHHIIPLVEDFEKRLDDDNLITLCRYHHEQAERGNISRTTLRESIPPPN